MLNEAMFSSKTDLWETPQDLFDELNEEFHFDLDVCATEENAKCKKFYTKEQDGLTKPWTGTVWCNPPYGKEIGKWVERAYNSVRDYKQRAEKVVMLLPARTDTKWFHKYIYHGANEIRFLEGRLHFGNSKNSAPFPSMIVVFCSII